MSKDGLAKPSPWTVLAVRFGTRRAVKSKVYLNYHLYGDADADVEMDYFFWVLTRGSETILVDTGFNPTSGGRRNRTMLIEPRTALAELGIAPGGIEHVILSHLHYDHAGNLDLAPDAALTMARAEFDFWTGDYGRRPLFASAVERDDIEQVEALHAAGRLTLTEGDLDLAPGVRIVELGGHTPGQTVVIVDTATGPVVLASDAIHYYEELDLDRPFAEVSNLPGMYRGFDVVRDMVEAGATLIPGHDPDVMRRFPAVGSETPNLAVRIG